MPSGKVHAVCSVLLSAASFGAALGMTNDVSIASTWAGGCLLGIPLTPDLDQENLGMSERWLIKYTLGFGYVFAMFWYPYAHLIPHRSPLSHLPIVGTLGRLMYLAIPIGIAFAIGWRPPIVAAGIWTALIGGLALSDAAHWALDTRFGMKGLRGQRGR